MVDDAHEAVWFDGSWAINSQAVFKKAMQAVIRWWDELHHHQVA
jgi:hypothetical protein